MAIRAVLDASGLKISKPGFDADSTAEANLNFNSDWSAFGVFLQDTHQVNWPVLPLSQDIGSYSHDVNYGTTFTTPPVFHVEVEIGGVWRVIGGSSSDARLRREIRIYDGGRWSRTAFFNLSVGSTETELQIRGDFDVGGIYAQDRFQPPNLLLRYTVFSYNF
ncbi:hypothetical protein [Pelagibacterium lacus]|uniref:Uncharacterized protein n=1 Tax=Pelagibacterium lacus TaxID=2282655 RepID=A0A369W6M8_9HYPH|nr:hypothetical protein [Pelagibacterium lacus]RDE10344.1 hypothetical protein DVH29_02865 [Pelagibacterium lacus]